MSVEESVRVQSADSAPLTPNPAEGKYVYCIIESDTPRRFGPIGIGGRGDEVYTVHYRGLAAVVSDTPVQPYDPTRETALAHGHVQAAVPQEFTATPMTSG